MSDLRTDTDHAAALAVAVENLNRAIGEAVAVGLEVRVSVTELSEVMRYARRPLVTVAASRPIALPLSSSPPAPKVR